MRFAFFDLDDTLLDTRAAIRAWSLDFVREYGLGEEEAAAEVVRRRVHAVDTWAQFVENVREWFGVTADPDELFARIATDYPAKFRLAPDVAEGLTRLRESGWRLGIVTNGTTRMQQAKIDHVGLRRYVDVALDSEAAGCRKPDVRIFELAAEKLGVELGPEGWMVGDAADKDIAGGVAAGLRTIWLPHGVALPDGSPSPDHTVSSIAEALAIIAAESE
jgi:HAD superfamily hydrolase (TIGR01509 family)